LSNADLNRKATEANKKKEDADKAIKKATEDKADAEETKTALNNVAGLVNGLAATTVKPTTQNQGRQKRQAATTPYTFDKPDTCAKFIIEIANVGIYIFTEDNVPKALALVKVLLTVTKTDFTCTPTEVSTAKEKIDDAEHETDKAIVRETNEIAAETQNYNDAVEQLKDVNTQLVARDLSTLNPGTPLPSVATVTQPEAPTKDSQTTGGGGDAQTTSEGGSPPSSPATEASSPPATTTPRSTVIATNAPGRRRARGLYLNQFGIDLE